MVNNINVSSSQNPFLTLLKRTASSSTPLTTALNPGANTRQMSAANILAALCARSTNISAVNQLAVNALKKPPFAPNDVNLFTPQVYSDATALQPAAPKTITETQIKGQLTKTFNTRFNGNPQQISAGMAVYNDPTTKQIVPDMRLRASLAALKGTPGESAINAIKSGAYSNVAFKDLPAGVIAATQNDPTGNTKPQIFFNNRYQYEDFRQLSPAMAHETLHQDATDSAREERINASMDTMVYGKMMLEDPKLANEGTELARRQNTKFMARLNSRDTNGNLRLFTSQGNVYPGGTALANFGAAFSSVGGDTSGGTLSDSSPGNAALRQMLKGVTGVNVNNPNFDSSTEGILDNSQIVFTPTQLVQLAKILKLKV